MPPLHLAPKEDFAIYKPGSQKRKAEGASRDEIRPTKRPTIEQQTPDARFDRSAVKAKVNQIGKSDEFAYSNSVEAVKC
jgi:hypothetical protein